MASPAGSLTISTSGGRSQPVSQGEMSRAAIPDGAIRKASPKAAAACGTDSSGDMRCCSREKAGVPAQPARNSMTMASAAAAVATPAVSDSSAECQMPGWARSWRKGSSVSASPPSAGR